MSTKFRTFKHTLTGKVGNYPDHFEEFPEFSPCDPEPCRDCTQEKEPEEGLETDSLLEDEIQDSSGNEEYQEEEIEW